MYCDLYKQSKVAFKLVIYILILHVLSKETEACLKPFLQSIIWFDLIWFDLIWFDYLPKGATVFGEILKSEDDILQEDSSSGSEDDDDKDDEVDEMRVDEINICDNLQNTQVSPLGMNLIFFSLILMNRRSINHFRKSWSVSLKDPDHMYVYSMNI